MSAYVTPGEVASRLRRSTPSDIGGDGYVLMVIESVEAAISSWASRTYQLTISDLDADEIRQAVLDVAARIVQAETAAPDGASQRSVSVDDVTVSKRWESSTARSVDDLLASWWARLAPAGRGQSGTFSISPSFTRDVPTPCW